MYQIPIDAVHYHVNALSPKELAFAGRVFEKCAKKHPSLHAQSSAAFGKLSLNESGVRALQIEVTAALCRDAMATPPKDEAELLEAVKERFFAVLPIISKNLQQLRLSHPVQFEPITAAVLYISGGLLSELAMLHLQELSEFESVYLQEVVAFFRAIRSSALLFCTGDDVHGVSLYRGVLEIFSKLRMAPQHREEYVLFKSFNLYLQQKKQTGGALPREMTEYLAGEEEYKRNPESFLAYGWAKNAKGRRILTMSELLRAAAENKGIDRLLQLASEFVHEDYIGIGYDYIAMRKVMLDYYYWLLLAFLRDGSLQALLSPKMRGRLAHLEKTVSPFYTGEFSLSLLDE